MREEIWKPVVGWEDRYAVSSHGRVKRVAHEGWNNRGEGFKFKKKERIVGEWQPECDRYPRCTLFHADGKSHKLIHVLVAEAFLGAKPEGMEVNHIDGDRKNNHVSNLEYVDRQGNMNHAKELGLIRRGETSATAKLTEEDVRFIRSLKGARKTKKLSERYNVSKQTIRDIQHRRTWRHLEEENV